MTGIAVSSSRATAALSTSGAQLFESAVSEDTSRITHQIRQLRNEPSPGSVGLARSGSGAGQTLEERLFDAVADAKILTAQVAMHLDQQWRTKLFQQLDSLHDPAEWEPADDPVERSSFSTFLKAMLSVNPSRRPGLGLSSAGHPIAAWTVGRNRLTIEFLPEDRVRWVLTRVIDNEPEHFAGQTPVTRLLEGLQPYHPETWFSHAAESDESSR